MTDSTAGPPRIVPTRRQADLLLAAGLAFICTALARDYLNPQQLADVHAALVERRSGDGPTHYRILTYWVPQALSRNGFGLVQAYLLAHFATLFGAFGIFARGLRRWLGDDGHATPMGATLALAALYALGLEPGVIQAADSWTLLCVALLFYTSTAPRLSTPALALTFALAAVTKENAFFYAPFTLWRLAQNVDRGRWLWRAVCVFGPGVLLWWLIRAALPVEAGVQRQWLSNFWITAGALRDLPWLLVKGDFFSSVSRAGALHWLIAFAPFFAWALTRDWRAMDSKRIWIAASLPAPIALNLLLGVSAEFRIFVDAFIWIAPLVLGGAAAPATWPQLGRNLACAFAGGAVTILLLFAADAALGPNGYWTAEFDGARRFRWFDRRASETIRLANPPPTALYLPLKISGAGFKPGETRTVRVTLAQGERRVRLTVQAGETWTTVRLPMAEFKPGPLELALESDFYFVPAALPGASADRRILSAQAGDARVQSDW